jgi:hypothetical protein
MEDTHMINSYVGSIFLIVVGVLYILLFIIMLVYRSYATHIFPVNSRMPPKQDHGYDEVEEQPFINIKNRKLKSKNKSKAKKKEAEKRTPKDVQPITPVELRDPNAPPDPFNQSRPGTGFNRDPDDINPLEGERYGNRLNGTQDPRYRASNFDRGYDGGYSRTPDGGRSNFGRDDRGYDEYDRRDQRSQYGRGSDGRDDYNRGRDDYNRDRDDYNRGRDDYNRGRDDRYGGTPNRDEYDRSPVRPNNGRDDYNRSQQPRDNYGRSLDQNDYNRSQQPRDDRYGGTPNRNDLDRSLPARDERFVGTPNRNDYDRPQPARDDRYGGTANTNDYNRSQLEKDQFGKSFNNAPNYADDLRGPLDRRDQQRSPEPRDDRRRFDDPDARSYDGRSRGRSYERDDQSYNNRDSRTPNSAINDRGDFR